MSGCADRAVGVFFKIRKDLDFNRIGCILQSPELGLSMFFMKSPPARIPFYVSNTYMR